MEYGTHDELVTKENGIYATMFAEQAKYYVEGASYKKSVIKPAEGVL